MSDTGPDRVGGEVALIDRSTEFGQRVERRLREEFIAWLTTVDAKGRPQPVPVWFLWDGADSILLYSKPNTPKLRAIELNPRVSLNLDGNGKGGDIVVVLGEAEVAPDERPAHEVPIYVDKYRPRLDYNGWSPEEFAADYSVAVRVQITRVRGH
jgi:PPOX class probable F420-dependent enzyme